MAGQASYWSMLTRKLLVYLYFYWENTLFVLIPVEISLYVDGCSLILELVQKFVVMKGFKLAESDNCRVVCDRS